MGVKVKWNPTKKAWYVYINDKGARQSLAFGDNEAAANDSASEILKEMRLGQFKIKSREERVSLKAFAEDVLALVGDKKESTVESYDTMARNHIYGSALGRMQLTMINKGHIESFLNDTRKNLAYGSTRLVLAVLSIVFNKAIDRALITANPASDMASAIPKDNEDRLAEMEEVKVFTLDEVEDLLEGIRDLRGIIKYGLFLCLARTGMRISEGLAVKWDCVDFGRHRILVKRNISAEKLSTPKGNQKRYIDMTPQLESVLLRLKQRAGDDLSLDAFVFPNRKGGFLQYKEVMERTWDPVVDGMFAERVTPHMLRHTFASELLAAGKSIIYVSELLGHSDVSITLNTYGHLIPGDQRNSIDVLDGPQDAHPRRILHVVNGRGEARKSRVGRVLSNRDGARDR